MINQHPITPPPELVQQWRDSSHETNTTAQFLRHIAFHGTQWGWNQCKKTIEVELQAAMDAELEACCKWLGPLGIKGGNNLRLARRPKPPSLNSIALRMLGTIESDGRYLSEITDTIRRALEALPND